MCARHYRQGPVWLSREVTGIQGSVLYTILLENGQTVCQHMEQMGSRMDSEDIGDTRDGTVTEDDPDPLVVGT